MPDRSQFSTERRLAESMTLDTMSVADAVAVMNGQDRVAVEAAARCAEEVTQAIELIVGRLQRGGRLIYVGAGTSGRLGVLDASECPPTFRTEPDMVQGVIAGGPDAMFRSKEGVEDDAATGAGELDARNVTAADAIVGIAAGGTTPFVHGALHRARDVGAATVFLSCVDRFDGEPVADVIIRAITGPEVLTGSTRLKAGTATKLILNQISTLAMVRLGKCYENLMVDVKASNAKLRDRAARIVATLTGVELTSAADLLTRAGGDVKVAVVMHALKIGADASAERLRLMGGRLRDAIDHPPSPGGEGGRCLPFHAASACFRLFLGGLGSLGVHSSFPRQPRSPQHGSFAWFPRFPYF